MKRILLAAVLGVVLGFGIIGVIASRHFVYHPFFQHEYTFNIILTFLSVAIILSLIQINRRLKQKANDLKSQKMTTLEQLHKHQNLFDAIFNNTNNGVAILNLEGKLIRTNHALCHLLGYTSDQLFKMNFYHLIEQKDRQILEDHLQQLLNNQVNLYQAEQRLHCKNNELIWVMSTLTLIHDVNHSPICFVVQIQNISLQKNAEERLKHMAYHDALTGLANRNKLEQFINHMLSASRRHEHGFAVIFMDLDRFKNINDTIGHEAGDLILQIVAERLHASVRTTDMVARLGGDEFVIVITDVKQSESVAIITQKILENIMEVILIKGQEIFLTASLGISLYPTDGQNIQTLMKNADLALYRSKEYGRNNYQFYTLEMTNKALEKMALQNALAHALVRNEFLLHYQPKMDLQTRRIVGVEALLRWKNTQYGYITPDEIIALAEESGLINQVTEWVIATGCKQLKKWHEMGLTGLTLSVNCSPRQFKQSAFPNEILKILTGIGVLPQSLIIEVTEETLMHDPENTLRTLYTLRDIGIKIAIDDFGTGYWSLGNLRRLSVDEIKIDKTFIKKLHIDETSRAIITAIIAMVHKLGIKVVAEGVETREQYDFLLNEGCTEIQGYYLTRPSDETVITSFLKHPVPDAEAISNRETVVE